MGASFSNSVLRFLTETQLETGRVSQPPVATTPNMVVPPGASLGQDRQIQKQECRSQVTGISRKI